jgi:hypothetical protein
MKYQFSYICDIFLHSSVVEQSTINRWVLGSNPSGGAKTKYMERLEAIYGEDDIKEKLNRWEKARRDAIDVCRDANLDDLFVNVDLPFDIKYKMISKYLDL